MKGDDKVSLLTLRHGPLVWAISALLGLAGGALGARLIPATVAAGQPVIHPWMAAPFALLLAAIALMPFISQRIWHRHFPDIAFGLGGLVAGYYLAAFTMPGAHGVSYGREQLGHALLEYFQFIALIGGLYVVSGGILIETRGRARPLANVLLLGVGAMLANIVGTTGASVLLIRPFMRLNQGRLRPIHVVFFIFIVSNCGGSLTPIGDPPLYLGFLKGVPFLWTLAHLWQDWALTLGALLALFFVIDSVSNWRDADAARRGGAPEGLVWVPRIRIRGGVGIACLGLMLLGVFLDVLLERAFGLTGFPFGAVFQVGVAWSAHRWAPRRILDANDFSFFPLKEVALLFVGIFITMIPALGYLSANGARLGVDSPTRFYFATGALSAVLDNAPTYLNFLQVALAPDPATPAAIHTLIADPGGQLKLRAISTGAVFFGAMTYIGNGPNFMVRAIAESAGVKMPSFLGYLLLAVLLLLPVLMLHWAILIR